VGQGLDYHCYVLINQYPKVIIAQEVFEANKGLILDFGVVVLDQFAI
jgi:hypothetical protein